MSRSLADPLFERLFRAFPADQAYTWTDWESDPMPEPVRHFLAQMLRHQSRHEARRLRRACTDWVDYDHPAMERAFDRLTLEMEDHGQVPRKEWPDTLRKATQHVSSYLVRPVHVLVEFVFGEQTRPLDLSTIRWRMRFFGPYAYLREAVDAYADQRDLSTFQREPFEHFLRRIDARLTTDYGADRWLRLLEPLFRITRVATDSDSVPVRQLVVFFEEKEADDVAAALQAYRRRGHDHVGRSALRRLIQDALAPDDTSSGSAAPSSRGRASRDSPPLRGSDDDAPAAALPNDSFSDAPPSEDPFLDASAGSRPSSEPSSPGPEPRSVLQAEDESPEDQRAKEPSTDSERSTEPPADSPSDPQGEPVPESSTADGSASNADSVEEEEARENPWKSDDPWSRIRAQMEAEQAEAANPSSESPTDPPPADPPPAEPAQSETAAADAASEEQTGAPDPADAPTEPVAQSQERDADDAPGFVPDASEDTAPEKEADDDSIWGVQGAARPAGGTEPNTGPRRGSPAENNESTPLWKRFQGGRASRAESASGAPSPPPAASDSADGSDQPLWAQFQKGRQTRGRAHEDTESPPASAASGPDDASSGSTTGSSRTGDLSSEAGAGDLAALERTVLGESNPPHRSVYVRQLFGNSMDAYRRVLQTLAAIDTWGEASQVIARDVFRRHKVNIYSDAAVHFTNAVETRYREKREA